MIDMRLFQRGALRLMFCLIVLLTGTTAFASDLSFADAATIPWPESEPAAITAADFNSDGAVDLAVLTNGTTIEFLYGNGVPNGSINTGIFNLTALAHGDFNHDGKPDLALISPFGGEVTILTNNGSSPFTATTYSVETAFFKEIAAGDFNGDGWDDLALLSSDGSVISLHLNDKAGSFTAVLNGTAATARVIRAADYNHDSQADLLVINSTGNSVTILLGQADGSFTAGPSKALPSSPVSAAMADFDGDGFSDLAIAANSSAYVLPGNGDGTFGNPVTAASNQFPTDLAAADFNNDGKIDLIIINQGGIFGSDSTVALNSTTHLWSATYPKAGPASTSSIQLLAKLLVPGTVYAVCVPNVIFGGPAPSSEQVKNGQDGSSNFLSDNLKGSVSVAANTETSISCNFLSPTTSYDVYVVAEATSPLYLQPTPIKMSSATAPETPTLDSVTAITARGFTANWFGVQSATSYQLDVSTNADFSTFAPNLNSLDVGLTDSFAVTGLTPGTTYHVRLRAVFSGSASASSNSKNLTTLPVPGTPTLSSATGVSSNSFTTNWGAVAGATGYYIDVASDAAFTNFINFYDNLPLSVVTTLPIYVTNPGGTYYYRVRAANNNGSSDSSSAAVITLPPTTPFAGTIATASTSGFTAIWGESLGASGYRLDVATNPEFTTYLSGYTNRDVGNVRSFLANGTTPGLTYYYRVTAYNSGPYSATSQTITVSIPAVPPITLNAPRAYLTGSVPASSVSTDFNGDGINDLVSLSPLGSSFTIHLGNGDGSHTQQPPTATRYSPSNVVAADFNKDGKLDLAITNAAFTSYSIFLGTGTGTFQPEIWKELTGPGELMHIAAGDLNGDGIADLVITSYVPLTSANTAIHTLLGSGTGTFIEKAVIPCGTFPRTLVLAHLDNDNKLDILAATKSGNQLEILYGLGDGTASPAVTLKAPELVTSINVIDFNDDGRLDIALTNSGFFTVFLQSTVARTFINATAYFPESGLLGSLATGDFDKDGKSDLVAGVHNSSFITIFKGDGAEHLTTKTNIDLGHTTTGILVTDLNKDGAVDIVTNSLTSVNISVALNSGNGTFPTPIPYTVNGAQYRTTTGDFNGDGNSDLAVANYSGAVSILLGNGTGTFGPPTTFNVGTSPYDVASGDFNGDGKLDLVVSDTDPAAPAFYVLIGNGTGGFAAPIPHSESARTDCVVTGDFNLDGKLDVIVNNYDAGTVSVLLGNGDGSFGAKTDYPAGALPNDMILADLNGDGFPDVVTANSGYISVLAGSGDGTLLPAIHYWTGSRGTVTAGSFTSSGRIDLAVDAGLAGGVLLLLNTTVPSLEPGYPRISITGETTAQVLLKSTIGGTAYAVCLPTGSIAPTPLQIKSGQDASYADLAANLKGSIVVTAHNQAAITCSALTKGAAYDVYVILEDTTTTMQPVPGFVTFTQPPSLSYTLTVTVSGGGSVTGTSTTPGDSGSINCSAGTCSALFPAARTVNLAAATAWYSSINWANVTNSSGSTATVLMDAAKDISVSFNAAQNVQVSNPFGYHGSIKTALDTAADSATVKAKAMPFPDVFTLNRPGMSFTLLGGFAQLNDSTPNGVSTIPAPFTITGGRLNIGSTVKITP